MQNDANSTLLFFLKRLFSGASFPLCAVQRQQNAVALRWETVSGADGYAVFDGFKRISPPILAEPTFLAEAQRLGVIHSYCVAALRNGRVLQYSTVRKIGFVRNKEGSEKAAFCKAVCKLPISTLALHLTYIQPLFSDPRYHYWGVSALAEGGKIHIFAARIPTSKCKRFDPGWKEFCEIVHFTSDTAQGPFSEEGVVFSNDNLPDAGMRSPHNPKIAKIDGIYCLLFIVQTSADADGQKTLLATAENLSGPWKFQGHNGVILAYDGRVVNPDILKLHGQYILYFKTRHKGSPSTFYAAVSDRLTGPYKVTDRPVIDISTSTEDLDVFEYQGKVYMLSTDNHGLSGYKGAGLLWESEDGLFFDAKHLKLGFGKLGDYCFLPKGRTMCYGKVWDKHERPEILFLDGKPAYFYAASSTGLDGLGVCQNYIYKIDAF